MYICESCDKVVGPGIPSNRVVVETRSKVYPPRPQANDPGGSGREIAKEICVCPECNNG